MKLLACLFALLVCLLPIAASSAENPAQDLRSYARLAGLPDSVEIRVEPGIGSMVNAGYWRGGPVCVFMFFCSNEPEFIILALPESWPLQWKVAVLYHEIGHYVQYHAGTLRDIDQGVGTEWEADRWAADQMTALLGWSGPQVAGDALSALWRLKGNSTSMSHGGLIWRIRAIYDHGAHAPEAA